MIVVPRPTLREGVPKGPAPAVRLPTSVVQGAPRGGQQWALVGIRVLGVLDSGIGRYSLNIHRSDGGTHTCLLLQQPHYPTHLPPIRGCNSYKVQNSSINSSKEASFPLK